MKTYYGRRTPYGMSDVWITDEQGTRQSLAPRHDLRNHSPTGFEWGYGGSGPAQLALALLADALANDQMALKHYQEFKWSVISKLEGEWRLTELEIRGFVESPGSP